MGIRGGGSLTRTLTVVRVPRPVVRAAARLKPRVPDRVWPALLQLRSLTGSGPTIGLPAFDRMLVLAAHPDDETLGCGGTMALAARRGTDVRVLVLTDGEATVGSTRSPADTAALRRREVRRATDLLGASVELAGLPDGGLATSLDAVRDAIDGALASFRPDVVLAPWLGDGHADHRAVAEALAAAPNLAPHTEVWGYETWTALPATRLVDITDAIEAKEAALAAHVTAALAFDLSAGLGLSRWRSIHGLMGRGWAEAFLAGTAPDHRELAARWSSLDGSPR